MRPTDTVCRWEADQFVILADCSYSDGMRRAYQMGPRLRGRYQVTVEGAERVVDVVARLGVGAYRTGSTIGELIATANSALGRSTTA
jgi:GGDEF domain-containing protein